MYNLSLFQAFFEHVLVWTNGLTGRKKCLTAWLFYILQKSKKGPIGKEKIRNDTWFYEKNDRQSKKLSH